MRGNIKIKIRDNVKIGESLTETKNAFKSKTLLSGSYRIKICDRGHS